MLAANPSQDPLLEAGDVVFIPQRPSTIAVLGEVMQPGSYAYKPGATVGDYVRRAGGYAQFSNEDMTFIVQPDGSARRIETSWLNFDAATLPPGSAIVVPRDLAPLNARQIILDVTGIMSSLAVTIASLAVLSNNSEIRPSGRRCPQSGRYRPRPDKNRTAPRSGAAAPNPCSPAGAWRPGDIGGLVFRQREHFVVAGDLGDSGHHDPVFGALMVHLQ